MPPFSALTAAMALALPLMLQDCGGRDATALGLTSRERVALTATASEIVTALPVAEGATVAEGTLLVQLDDRVQAAAADLARANLAQAEAALAKLRAGARAEELAAAAADVAGAEAALRISQATWERNRTLVKSDAVSRARLDEDAADRDAAEAALDHARQSLLELRNGARPEDLAAAEAEVAAAAASLRAEERKRDDLAIRASRAGTLDSLPWNLGERATEGSPVAVLLAAGPLLVRAYVPEPYRAGLAAGDGVTVRIDGVDGSFEGRLRWISSDPAFTPYYALNQSERSRLMYLAEVTLPPEADAVAVGVPAQLVLK